MKRLELKVGLFVLISLTLLGALLLQFSKGTTLFRSTYTILLHSQNVGGLKARAQVLMAGVQIGTVSDIKLEPDGKSVTIKLRIYQQYVVYKNAKFLIEQSGFLGDQYVAIMPASNEGPRLENNSEAQAEPPFNMLEVAHAARGFILRIDETAVRLNDAIADVRRLVLNQETLTNLSAAVGNLRVFSEQALGAVDNINALVTSNGPALASSGSNLVAFSEQLSQFGGGLKQVLATNSTDIQAAVKNIESSTQLLKSLLEDAQAGKGLAGALLKNEQVADDVAEITRNLSISTSNLNRLGLWGILWQHKPARTNAPSSGAGRSLPAPKSPFSE
jgi:phospholipid/cholesterol/gamma-HCH transport system substrate-binding protein